MNKQKEAAMVAHMKAERDQIEDMLAEAGVPIEEDGYVMSLLDRVERVIRMAERVEEADRWARRMRLLENRIRFAMEIFKGEFEVPEINELRRVRGLEELPQLSKEYGHDGPTTPVE